jgi:hypothetical protein
MMHPLFDDMITVYRKGGERYSRHVIVGVQCRQKIERLNDNGKLSLVTVTSVTIPGEGTAPVKPGDVLVLGEGPELTEALTIARLKAENETYCTIKGVADNTRRPQLKHWKVTAV